MVRIPGKDGEMRVNRKVKGCEVRQTRGRKEKKKYNTCSHLKNLENQKGQDPMTLGPSLPYRENSSRPNPWEMNCWVRP